MTTHTRTYDSARQQVNSSHSSKKVTLSLQPKLSCKAFNVIGASGDI